MVKPALSVACPGSVYSSKPMATWWPGKWLSRRHLWFVAPFTAASSPLLMSTMMSVIFCTASGRNVSVQSCMLSAMNLLGASSGSWIGNGSGDSICCALSVNGHRRMMCLSFYAGTMKVPLYAAFVRCLAVSKVCLRWYAIKATHKDVVFMRSASYCSWSYVIMMLISCW